MSFPKSPSIIGRTLFGILALASIAFASPSFAAGETLEVHVHKNDLTGDEWANGAAPIKVSIRSKDGTPIGLGLSGIPNLNAAAGGLAPAEEQVCAFSWTDANGAAVQREIKLPRFTQRPAGEFLLPPARITSEKLLMGGQALQNCGGDEAKYQALQQELLALPNNPFRNYREFLSLPAEALLGQDLVISIAAGDQVATLGANPLPGFVCRIPESAGDPTRTGLCEQSIRLDPANAEDGIFRVDLVMLTAANGAVSTAPIAETLTAGVNAEFSQAVTMVGNFLMRTTSLLDWTLAINDTGLRNENITLIYQKALDIVNGLFILALLSIALLWNFSLLISRERIKKMMILFVIGIIGVNFTLPVTRLLADATNLLERTLLVKESPPPPESGFNIATSDQENLNASETNTVSRIAASDILSASDLDFGGFIGLQKSAYLEKTYPRDLGTAVDTAQLSAKDDLYMDRFSEPTWFNLVLIALGAFGQLGIALILLFRHIILWFLLIFSPFLLVFALFESTRPLLRSWGWLYARWLLIGPILAMTLFIVVNIWSLSGVPLESSYAAPSNLLFPNTTNLYVAAPGITSGYLNTPREVMKYIAALMMLYLCIFLPFWLTRSLPAGGIGLNSKNSEKKKFSFFAKETQQSSETEKSGTHTQERNAAGPILETHDPLRKMDPDILKGAESSPGIPATNIRKGQDLPQTANQNTESKFTLPIVEKNQKNAPQLDIRSKNIPDEVVRAISNSEHTERAAHSSEAAAVSLSATGMASPLETSTPASSISQFPTQNSEMKSAPMRLNIPSSQPDAAEQSLPQAKNSSGVLPELKNGTKMLHPDSEDQKTPKKSGKTK